MNTLTVGELAASAGITVRTLHHYDEIGLLAPTGRTRSGYRIYDEDTVDRLRAILTYRELGLGLDEVAAAIDGEADSAEVLRAARSRIGERITKLRAIASSLDDALVHESKGTRMTPQEKLAVFGDFDPDDHATEAEHRWGGTLTYAESTKRTSSYTKDDWRKNRIESAAIDTMFLDAMSAGAAPDSAAAQRAVISHREHISQWFYECTPEIHAGLGEMYVMDSRFTSNMDKAGDGLAAYMAAAIDAAYR